MKRIRFTPLLPLLLAASASAQTNGGTGKGLDSLDEKQVMVQLATSNLPTLLQRDFDNFNITAGDRDQIQTYIKLKQLENGANLRVAERRALVLSVAHGLDAGISKASDVDALLDQGTTLFSDGIVPAVSELEYFGEDPVAQAQLKPVAETAKKLFQQVVALASSRIDVLGDSLKTDADLPRIKPQLDKMRTDKFTGQYMDNRSSYALCISTPKSDPSRKTLADAAIEYLTQFDNADSGQQANVRLQMAKLQLAKGDYTAAKTTFDSVGENADHKITPPPVVAEENDGKYFAIVAEILGRKLPDAAKDIPELESWTSINYLPKLEPADQSAVKAALVMLKFRLYSAQSDLTNDDDEKKKTNDQAIEVLSQLLKDQPGLKDLIFGQLVDRIPEKPDLATLNPLVLQALQQQGFNEVIKPADQKVDEKNLQRAITAAQELVKRKGQPGVEESDADTSSFFIAYAYDRLHQDKQAAAAFMDFAKEFPADKARATDALDHATAIIGELRKKDRTGEEPDPDTRKLYDQFLPLAIGEPFNRRQFAFQYAALLQAERKFKEAVIYFEQVPQDSKQYPDSQYLEMLALSQEITDSSLTSEQRKQIVSQILDLTAKIDAYWSNASGDQAKKKYVEWVVNADQIAADLTRRELKDPAKSLQILDGFENKIAGAKDPQRAHVSALQIRINDFMDAGKIDQATQTLVTLLATDETQGQGLMFDVLKTVGHDMDNAKGAGDVTELKKLAQDQAQLSGFVVDWATKNKDPKVQAQLGQFQLFSADSKREAAELTDDPQTRQKQLDEALKSFQGLLDKDPDNLAAQQGVGLVQYDLQHYQQAVDALSPLITNKKVGDPVEVVTVNGAEQIIENTQYWEANYKMLRSLVELARQNPNDPQAQKYLSDANSYVGTLYILNGKKTGGKTYHDDFEKLKTEIAGLVKPAK